MKCSVPVDNDNDMFLMYFAIELLDLNHFMYKHLLLNPLDLNNVFTTLPRTLRACCSIDRNFSGLTQQLRELFRPTACIPINCTIAGTCQEHSSRSADTSCERRVGLIYVRA